jgi:uncharacterized protein YbjT (DUF2867 family)
MSKLLTVFGATGNQGGSVIRTVLEHPQLSKTYTIRAVTRDVSKPAATALKDKGCEVVAVSPDYHIRCSGDSEPDVGQLG